MFLNSKSCASPTRFKYDDFFFEQAIVQLIAKMCSMITDYVPKAALTTFAALGALWFARKFVSYVALVLDLFVLTGTNVSR